MDYEWLRHSRHSRVFAFPNRNMHEALNEPMIEAPDMVQSE